MVKGIECLGVVVDSLKDRHKVRLETGQVVTGYVSGKLRKNHILIIPGDSVRIELGQFNLSLGRITYRF